MSNDADNLEERIAAYIDGQLPPAEAARLEVYLANTDAKLAEQVINMIGDRHRIQSLPKVSAPDDLAARIMEQVERTSLLHNVDQLAPPRRPWWQTRIAAAALLFLVLGGFTYYMLQALRPANPAWEAALDTNPATHLPTIGAGPASTIPSMSTLAQTAQLEALKKDAEADKLASTAPAGLFASAAANAPLIVGGTELEKAVTARPVAPPPVTLAFVAHDSGDFIRLQSTIEAVQAAGNGRFKDVVTDDQTTQDRGKTAAGAAGAGLVDAPVTAATPAPAEQAVRSRGAGQVAANRDGYNSQSNDSNQGNFGMRQRAAASESPLPAAAANNQVAEPAIEGQAKAAPTLPVTYHVALRQSEIDELTHQFQLAPASIREDAAASAPAPENIAHFRASAPATAPSGGLSYASGDTRIDCVITMSPPPPATAPATTQAAH